MAGGPVALLQPAPDLLVEMLSCAMDEPVASEYAPMIAAQLATGLPEIEPMEVPEGFRVLVIGAGVSGMCAAVSLQRAGIPFTHPRQERVSNTTQPGGPWAPETPVTPSCRSRKSRRR